VFLHRLDHWRCLLLQVNRKTLFMTVPNSDASRTLTEWFGAPVSF
jgi:hypothetical protein